MRPESHRAVIDRWHSPEALAARIGAKGETVRKWRHRNRIPAEWWAAIVNAESDRADGITAQELAELVARADSRELQDTGT